MQVLSFYELGRPVQDRFVSALKGEGLPHPMLAEKAGPPRDLLVWGGAAVGALVVLVILLRLGFGDLDASLALQPAWLTVLYGVILAVLALGVLRAAAATWQVQSLPFRPGVYLFPSGVVDATRYELKIFPLSRLVRVDGDATKLRLTFPEGASYAFALRGAEHQAQITTAIAEAQDALEKAHADLSKKNLSALDPLQDAGFVSPFAPTTPIRRIVPFWVSFALLVAAVLGAGLAPPVLYLRNMGSDAELFAAANRARTPGAYRAYIERGGRRAEVRDILLPRAELAEAEKTGTVEAIEKYDTAHPNSQIKTEVAASLRKAMLVELGRTAEKGTVTALLEFKKRHPQRLVDPELGQAVHAVYKSALENYRKEAASFPTAGQFVERLLAYCEHKGPVVEVRFQRKLSPSFDLAEPQVKKSPYYAGVISLPSRYFDESHAKKRETAVAKTLLARFGEVFPDDVLAFRLGEPVADPEAPLPNTTVPTLFIVHTAQVSAASYLSNNPRGVFVGLGMVFEMTFKVPDDPKPFKFKWTVWRAPDTTPEGSDLPFTEAVYEDMASEEYHQASQKYLAMFFKVTEPKTAP
jgi:hypothetical protein